ncbi:hypothetical protein BH11MYX3_BH11MYX3_06860 [soil metagenome]
MSSVNASLASACLLFTACVAEPMQVPDEPIRSVVEHHEWPFVINAQIDLLFVIDNSPAMAAAQTKLAGDYRAMIELLGATSIGLPDVHIGVVTTDPRDRGELRRAAFLADAPRFAWQRERNYTGPIADAFVDLAAVGVSGATNSQPLDAMLQALAVNPGFVREDAYLAVVILTAGDDHGTAVIDDVVHAIKSLKTDPSKVMVSGAFGACDANDITATAAPRLAAFVDQFPNRNAHALLCDADLTPLITPATLLLRATLGQPCLGSTLREPHECKAWLVDPHSDQQELLPECASPTSDRCWSLRPDDQACPGGQGLHLRPSWFPFSATLMFDCVVEAE